MTAAAAHAKRVALVIGNDAYRQVTALHNAGSDAKAVADALRETGFTVTLKQDLTLSQMKETLRAFKASIAGGDEALFYFSGHGVQFGGTNYLIPVDLQPQSEDQVADDAIQLQRVLDDLHEQKARFSMVIIDACRNNPFAGGGRAIGGRGLAPVTAANGQMILYSAGANQEALDSLGPADKSPNGVFTRVLIKEMKTPGENVYDVLRHVREQVVSLAKSVNHDQMPAMYDQSLGDFFFVHGGASAAGAVPAAGTSAAVLQVQSASELEQEYWNRIKDSADPKDFTDYQHSFPQGVHNPEASLMLRKLTAASTPAPQPNLAKATPASDAQRVPGAPPTAYSPSARTVSVLVGNVSFNNRAVSEAPALIFGDLKEIIGVEPSLPGGNAAADFGIGGNVVSIRPSLQRNQCAQSSQRTAQPSVLGAIGCLVAGKSSTAPYIATIPVQIEYRVMKRGDQRVVPYVFSKTYTLGAQQQEEAQEQALHFGIREGALAALASVGVLESRTDPGTRVARYYLHGGAAASGSGGVPPLLASNDSPGTVRALAVNGGNLNTNGSVEGVWSGTYACTRARPASGSSSPVRDRRPTA